MVGELYLTCLRKRGSGEKLMYERAETQAYGAVARPDVQQNQFNDPIDGERFEHFFLVLADAGVDVVFEAAMDHLDVEERPVPAVRNIVRFSTS